MILYQIISNYQLLNCIVHKIVKYLDDDAIIMVPIWIKEKIKDINKLLDIFNKIIIFNAEIYFNDRFTIEKNNKYFTELFKKENININDFDEIHVSGAHYSFGTYLVENKIPFIFWEDAAGLLSRPEIIENIDINFSQEKVKYMKLNGLYNGENKLIKYRFGNLKAQKTDYNDENIKHFDVIENLIKLPEKYKDYILKFFCNVSKIDIGKDGVLILTQHFANLKILSFEDQILIYQLFVDYFFPNEKIILKPHPDDIMYYSILFPQSEIIRKRFPSEIMPVIFNESPKIVATISSKAINNIRNIYNTFELNEQFEKDFYFLHRYYLSLRIANELKCSSVKMFGCNNVLIERLTHFVIKDNEVDLIPVSDFGTEKGLFIIDKAFNREEIIHFVENTDEDTVVIFINSQENYCFYDINHKDLWEYIIPKNIIKKCIKEEEFYSSLEEETVYVYSKNRRYRNMIQELEFNKKLENTGLEISVKSLTAEQLRIKVLEGILKATEERLLYYINLVKEFESNSK